MTQQMAQENKKQQVLKINRKFFDSLNNDNPKKVLRIYGFNNPNDFISDIIKRLNEQYEFLNIKSLDFLTKEEEREYHMYNGYISGNFLEYDLITVSFTTLKGKEGNVFLSQQIMPMITSKLQKDKKFLVNDRIKKICLLTTHKSNRLTPDTNEISDTGMSNIQMSIKYINTMGFDVIDVIHIKNLNTQSRYYSVNELIDHTDYIQSKNQANSQFKQIVKNDDIYNARFESTPKGQEQKFFALKLYAIIILLKGQNINISVALKQTTDITLRVMFGFIKYLKTTDITLYSIFRVSADEEEKEAEILEIIEIKEKIKKRTIQKDLPCYQQEPIIGYNKNGRMIFKTQRTFKKESFDIYGYKCACDNESHLYFKSESTKKPYIEGHHMIPMEYQEQYWKDKKRNLDCTINLIPLCPHCHRKIHKAVKMERLEIITEIFNKHKKLLQKIDSDLTLEKFAELYNVYVY